MVALVMCGEESWLLKKLATEVEALAFRRCSYVIELRRHLLRRNADVNTHKWFSGASSLNLGALLR